MPSVEVVRCSRLGLGLAVEPSLGQVVILFLFLFFVYGFLAKGGAALEDRPRGGMVVEWNGGGVVRCGVESSKAGEAWSAGAEGSAPLAK